LRDRDASAPVFLVGCQRSGTTALALHLQRHPALALTVNGKLLYLLIVWLLEQEAHAACGHVRLDEVAFAFGRKAPYNLSARTMQAIQAYLVRGAPGHLTAGCDPRAAIRAMLDDIYAIIHPDARRIGDKYNEYLLQLPAIHAIYPDARYIFVYRDPVDVAESMLRHFRGRPWAPLNVVQALDKWASWNARWLAMRGLLDPAYYIELCYEELVARPAQACASLFAFMGLPANEALVAQARHEFVASHVGKGQGLRAVEGKGEGEAGEAFCAALDRCQKVHNLLKAPLRRGPTGNASAVAVPITTSTTRTTCQS